MSYMSALNLYISIHVRLITTGRIGWGNLVKSDNLCRRGFKISFKTRNLKVYGITPIFPRTYFWVRSNEIVLVHATRGSWNIHAFMKSKILRFSLEFSTWDQKCQLGVATLENLTKSNITCYICNYPKRSTSCYIYNKQLKNMVVFQMASWYQPKVLTLALKIIHILIIVVF